VSGHELGDQLGTGREPQTEEEQQQARAQRLEAMAAVCHHVPDREARWPLYEALGLVTYDRGKFRSYQFGRNSSGTAARTGYEAGGTAKSGRRAVSSAYRRTRKPGGRHG
jgi:hypothetical protein